MNNDTKRSMWKPGTAPGRWAVRLGITFLVLFMINSIFMSLRTNAPWEEKVLPVYGIFMLLCGLASGILGLTAVIGQRERSLPVWLTILPLLLIIFLFLGEVLGPPH